MSDFPRLIDLESAQNISHRIGGGDDWERVSSGSMTIAKIELSASQPASLGDCKNHFRA
jgi:hypothetical protein